MTHPTNKTPWVVADDHEDLKWFTDAVQDAEPGICAFCQAPQPNDVRWPTGTLETRDSGDEDEDVDVFRFVTCPTCEPKVLAAMESMR